ncbi:MAG: phosphoribosylamine--glycine ligase [Candidatus Diapherotrites archaeon CG11_big_fil_rev_8_21_14_0_20_37_9]|nr:MAG: phosphoribosylamine--glycine ligase [Candidatus Diapherotrites archaeon CG11_big_fil_rev_8_21_14_0_20_37_9]
MDKLRVLVIGSGGREHTLAWKLSQSSKVDKIFCAPGNAGTALIGKNVPIGVEDIAALADFAEKEKIDLTIVGPEGPLVAGIVDLFNKKNLRVFGPSEKAAMIEGSKAFAKEIMVSAGVPTARYVVVTSMADAEKKLVGFEKAAVKADGLAAGKGVILCHSKKEIMDTVASMLEDKIFGEAGSRIVVEELLEGEETSVLAFCDGANVKLMVSSQDHKRIFDDDKGPNTGGMGAYSPAPVVNGLEKRILDEVMQPVVDEMKKRGIPYKGILYAGLMISGDKINVIEFNARFGDPETQAVLPRMESDLVDAIDACIDGTLDRIELKWKKDSACCVVIAAAGYPGNYSKGKEITGLNNAVAFDNVLVFHAGTLLKDGKIVTSGGRVLGVTGIGATIKEAIDNAYTGVSQIDFDGAQHRTDIGKRALDRL